MACRLAACAFGLFAIAVSVLPAAAEESTVQRTGDLPCSAVAFDVPVPRGVTPPRPKGAVGTEAGRRSAEEIDAWLLKQRARTGADFRYLIGRGTISARGVFTSLEVLCSSPTGIDSKWLSDSAGHVKFEPAKKFRRNVAFENYLVVEVLSEPAFDKKTCVVETLSKGWSGGPPSPLVTGQSITYPEEARRLNQEATVLFRLDVSASGQVSDAHIMCASGPGKFDEPTLSRLRTWKFPPLTINGVAQPHERYLTIEFDLTWF